MAKTRKPAKISLKGNPKRSEKSDKPELSNPKPSNTRRKSDTLALEKSQQRKVTKETKKIQKQLRDGTFTTKTGSKKYQPQSVEERGLIYIGHIPHGFYENEMTNYFKQFGKVTNVKVCRSRISGRSKGYGYVEFVNPEVAKIAADTMNSYIMFKKRVVAEFVPYEKRPKGLFIGKSSNLQHTSVKSRRGKQKHTRNRTVDEKSVEIKNKLTVKKFKSKLERLRNLGIQCDLIPADADSKVLKELKPEKKQADSKLKKATASSAAKVKSKKGVLSKSLQSIQLPEEEEEVQSVRLRVPKKEKLGVSKGGILKKKKPQTLDSKAVKRIARELIRKRGDPLINLLPSKRKQSKLVV